MKLLDWIENHANIAALLLLIVLFSQLMYGLSSLGLTNDEATHITSGYSYWKTGQFKMNPEHPPLIKLMGGFPLLFMDLNISFEDPSWVTAPRYAPGPHQWVFAKNFLFNSGNDPDKIIYLARIPIILLTIILGLFIFLWAKELFGSLSGLLALFLYTFDPNILANGRLVTTDLGISAFLFLSLYSYWRYLKKPTPFRLFLTGLAFGLCLAAKFTSVYLFVILAAIIFVHLLQSIHMKNKKFTLSRDMLFASVRKHVTILCVIIPVAVLILCTAYFFMDIPSYVAGLQDVIAHSSGRHYGYLLGDYSFTGWWYYFFVAFFLKSPIPLMLLLLITVISIALKKEVRLSLMDEAFLWFPVIIYFSAFIFNNINIGVRHILPIYPFLFVSISRLAKVKLSLMRLTILLLSIWLVIGTVSLAPDYLAYFNEITGGPDQGLHKLIDSNIDWGQDLKRGADWVHQQNISFIYLAYFGQDSPEYRGLNYTKLTWCEPTKGFIVISVNFLVGFTEGQHVCSSWLRDQLTPVKIIGHSLYIYNVTSEDVERIFVSIKQKCDDSCKDVCEKQNHVFKDSMINRSTINSCKCTCV